MIERIEFSFDTMEALSLPANIVQLRLEDISESLFLQEPEHKEQVYGRGKVIGKGLILINKAWFRKLAQRMVKAAQAGSPDPRVAPIFIRWFSNDHQEIPEWLHQGMPANMAEDTIYDRLSSYFSPADPSDLIDITLIKTGPKQEVLSLPWQDYHDRGQNQLAVNTELKDHFGILIDKNDSNITVHAAAKYRALGLM